MKPSILLRAACGACLAGAVAASAAPATPNPASAAPAADDAARCSAASGELLSGVVGSRPKFQAGSETLQGVKLSHTVLTLRADGDGQVYQVAMDNVFALDYVKNSTRAPPSLAALKTGTRLEVCGEKYTDGSGIHWVHTNCGDTPTPAAPDGWVKRMAGGAFGPNLERGVAYCYLWPHHAG